MGDGFFVDAKGILHVALSLRRDATALDASGGAIPEADAGVMTEVVENAVGAFLSQAALLASALVAVADNVEVAALDYHQTDMAAQEDLARLMLPGADERYITDTVERLDRSEQIELAQLLMPGDPDAAEQAVLNSPSHWDAAQDRVDDRASDLRDLLMPDVEGRDGPDENGSR